MKIVSVFLMIALIFGIPSIAFTQQNVILNSKDEILLAKEEAKRDAKNDTNRTLWFVGGFIGGGLIIAGYVAPEFGVEDLDSLFLSCIGLGICGGYVGTVLFRSPSPPSDRLLGKSPEYVTSYVNAYKDRVKEWQVISGGAGFALGFAGIMGIVLNFTDF